MMRYTGGDTAAIVQWQNAALWQRMSWVRNPLAAPITPLLPIVRAFSVCEFSLPSVKTVPKTIVSSRARVASPRKSEPVAVVPPAAPARLFAGTSGWAYPTWKPGFYPQGVSAKKMMGFYASRLNSVEVNYTFRKLATAAQLAEWMAQTGEGFRFSFKAPQGITHFKRLRECEAAVKAFYDSLKPVAKAGKLGLVLYQLPPNFKANLPLMREFLSMKCMRAKGAPRVAFEFRHESWFTEEAGNVLRRYDAAFCVAETDDLVTPEIHSAVGHTCFRLRRGGGYNAAEVSAFVARIAALTGEREVYAYFKHEDEPTGALNATAFLAEAAARGGDGA